MTPALDPKSLDLESLCLHCQAIARDAGDEIMQIYDSGFNIAHKQDNTPLTDADMASHRTIIDALAELTPTIPVLSEESEIPPYETRKHWRTFWLVDPLDGTREFIKRNGEFTVNIALIHQHRCILGVVHAPASGADYYAWHDGGAYKSVNGENAMAIHVRKLGKHQASAFGLVVAGSRSHGNARLENYIHNLQQDYGHAEVISMGSSLKFCLVAEGAIDIYPRLGPTSEWDTAASHCIVEQAGGFVTRTNMAPLEYNTRDSLQNPLFLLFGDDSHDWSQYL